MATELAKAYIQIIPTTKGIANTLETELGGEAEKAGESSGNSFSSGFGKAIGTVGKVALAAVSAAATACSAVVTKAVESYADYEQLVGGVETLFGDASETVIQNAANAFKTAGMSANDYMETVTGMAASLVSSLGGDTEEAANRADQALQDMSDNANKMGTDMESISNAYSGFAKQNFTMLDNLKLGYGGTQAEMKRLLEDAQAISGVEYDISSYSDIVSAIHVIQTEMGITGTTAEEASTTISGSLSMLKASWENVLTGMGDSGSDMKSLISDLVDSATTFAGNVVPIITQALSGVATLIEQLAPVIVAELPTLVATVLPSLLSAAISLLNSLFEALPSILNTVVTVVVQYLPTLTSAILGMLPTILQTLITMVVEVANGLAGMADTLVPAIIQCVLTVVSTLLSNLPTILDAVINLVESVADALLNDGLPMIMEQLPTILESLVDFFVNAFPDILNMVVSVVTMLIYHLPDIIEMLVDALPSIIDSIISSIIQCFPQLLAAVIQIAIALVAATPKICLELVKSIPVIFKSIIESIKNNIPQMKDVGKNIIMGLADGFLNAVDYIKQMIQKVTGTITNTFKSLLGIHSPSKVFKEFGGYLDQGLAIGISTNTAEVDSAIKELGNSTIQSGLSTVSSNINASVSEVNGNDGTMAQIVNLLNSYLPQIGNQQIVLDSGALVGGTINKIDSALGKRTVSSVRSVAFV